jgi:sugar (pentulose or hexulose) kinase
LSQRLSTARLEESTMAIVVFDIGKTNVKLSLVEGGTIRHTLSKPNVSLPGPPYLHFDAEGTWEFLLLGFTKLAGMAQITDIVPVAHGAAGALVDGDGNLALPLLDYEQPIEGDGYDKVAAPFQETFTPKMANGLVFGRQLYWQSRAFPEGFAQTKYILGYPQYWSLRLTGKAATEVTAIGCHSGLWRPAEGTFSSFTERMGWQHLFAPIMKASDVLGTVLPEIQRQTGLPADCRVRVGIHDSNASFLRHRLARPVPFAVASTGTWVVCMAAGSDPRQLPENRNCLANVDALGTPVATCNFMGGREFAEVTRGLDGRITTLEAVGEAIERGSILVPPLNEGGGPFDGAPLGGPRGAPTENDEQSVARASLYLALMTDYCFDLLKARGPVIVEGSLTGNQAYLAALATLRRAEGVLVSSDTTGTVSGAALLADVKIADELERVEPLHVPIDSYRRLWRGALPA